MGMADPGGTHLGTLLRRLRGSRGLTQAELAEKSGLSVQAISLLERGARRAPRITTVELLAEALELDGVESEALHTAARGKAPPGEPREEAALAPGSARGNGLSRGRRRSAALLAVLLTGSIAAAPLAWWRSHTARPAPIANLVGARVHDWSSANWNVGPLQTQRVYHGQLTASFAGTQESRLPSGVVPIVSYRTRTTNVVSYVRSVNRPVILIPQYNPEPRMSARDFVSEFEEQSDLIHSVHNSSVRVAVSAQVYSYQAAVNASAVSCGYIPPPSYVDYYLAAVFDPYLQGIARTDRGGFVVWQHCTNGLHRPRGLVEYGLGLGTPGSRSCQPEEERTSVMRGDMVYLHANLPDLELLEYWWATTVANPPCPEAWQFAAGSSTGDLWRTIANQTFSG
jgi:transcriptional regulator with XRE-family HTH domain